MYNLAQNFVVDPTYFYAESYITIPQVDLFCKSAPTINNNASGIYAPGISVVIVSTNNHVPNINDAQYLSQYIGVVTYSNIIPTNDATGVTSIVFPAPFQCQVGQEYSILVKYDGDDNFQFWEDDFGAHIVGPIPILANGAIGNTVSTLVSTGPSCQFVGPLFKGSALQNVIPQSNSAGANLVSTPNTQSNATSTVNPDATNWIPDANACLKFNVYYNRYNFQGVPVVVNTAVNTSLNSVTNSAIIKSSPGTSVNPPYVTFDIPCLKIEYISYNPYTSNVFGVTIGDRIWQEQNFWRGGDGNAAGAGAYFPCSFQQNTQTITAVAPTDFTKLFFGGPDDEYIILHSLNHDGAGQDRLNCRKIITFNASVITCDLPLTFSNSACFFYKSPVCFVSQSCPDPFSIGIGPNGNNVSNSLLLMCRDSNANSIHHFNDYCVHNNTILTGGLGYSNTDWCEVTGFENISCVVTGHFSAKANVQTNTTGGITSLYFSNGGCGFTNTANITTTLYQGGGRTPSLGSAFTCSYEINAIFRSELRGT